MNKAMWSYLYYIYIRITQNTICPDIYDTAKTFEMFLAGWMAEAEQTIKITFISICFVSKQSSM